MGFRLEFIAGDVTLLPKTTSGSVPDIAPERKFLIEHDESGYRLSFDGRFARVPDDAMQSLLIKVGEGSPTEWRSSSNESIQTTFRPLSRILQCLNSTPAYQLFLAGFQIGDAIGTFNLDQVDEQSMADGFKYLVGSLVAVRGKKGQLFFLPDEFINEDVEVSLVGNGKLFSAKFYTCLSDATTLVDRKLFVPYATPIGFNTNITPETKTAWDRISDLITNQSGGYNL